MMPDSPKKRAKAAPKKAGRKRGGKISAAVTAARKAKAIAPVTPAPESRTFNPYKLVAARDDIDRAAQRFRILFPTRYHNIICNMSPLDIMITAMQLIATDPEGGLVAAHPLARDIAPFMHPRLTHVHATGAGSKMDGLSDEKLAMLIAEVDKRIERPSIISGRIVEGEADPSGGTDEAGEGTATLLTVSR